MKEIKVYRVYDTEEELYWTSNTKLVWTAIGAAKNAWNVKRSRLTPAFNSQSRYVIHTFTLSFLCEEH